MAVLAYRILRSSKDRALGIQRGLALGTTKHAVRDPYIARIR